MLNWSMYVKNIYREWVTRTPVLKKNCIVNRSNASDWKPFLFNIAPNAHIKIIFMSHNVFSE